MSRLGHALHELDDPPVDVAAGVQLQPRGDVARCPPGAGGHAPRRPVHGRARAADDRHGRPRPTSSCRPRCSRSTPTCTTPTATSTCRGTSPRCPRPASACRTPRSSAASPRGSASTTRRCRSPTSTSRRRCCGQAGIELDDIRAEGFLRIGPPRGTAPFADGGFPTASGRVELVSQALVDAGRDGLPTYELPHEAVDDELAERFPLVLLAPAGRFFLNSTFAQLDWHRGKMGAPTVWLHPADAAARGLVDGDTVRCHNDRGAWTAALARQRCDAAGRLLHAQDAVAEAVAGRRERERLHPGAGHRHRRRPHVPRQPRRGLGAT